MSSNYSPGTGSTTGSGGGTDQARGSATSNAAQQIRETAGQIKEQAKNQAEQKFTQQKRTAVSEIENLAAALRQTAQTLQGEEGRTGQLLETAANRLERFSDRLDAQNLSRLLGDVEIFARRNPAAFLGTAIAVGFIAARFLKASSRSGYGYEGDYESAYATTGFDSGDGAAGGTTYGTTGPSASRSTGYGATGGSNVEPWGTGPDTSEEL